jgi:peptidoglycan/LPS O-acetylase OafA/YrhL
LKSIKKTTNSHTTIAMLDGVRAFACFCVISYHINRWTQGNHIWTQQSAGILVTAFALAGSYGVTLFFLLSGFLLFMPYVQSLLFDTPWPSIRRYYLRRIFRIWPGYYVSLILLILITHREYLQPDHWSRLLLFLTFLMDSAYSTYQSIDGPLWTLAVEWQFYVLLPILALGLRYIVQHGSQQRRLTILALALLGLILWGLGTHYWGRSWQMNPTQPRWIPEPLHHLIMFFVYGQSGKYLEDFAIGMLVCLVYVLSQQEPQHRLAYLCKKYSYLIWANGILWLFFAVIWPYTILLGPLVPYIGAHNWLNEIPYAVGFGLCGIAMLLGSSALRAPFEWRPTRWLGKLSYDLYIWHIPFITLFYTSILPMFSFHNPYLLYASFWLWIVCVVMLFGYIFYNVIERPGIKLGNKIIAALL